MSVSSENTSVNSMIVVESDNIAFSKRIAISESEKGMNGAPVGELFEVEVKSKESLIPLEKMEDIQGQVAALYMSNSWADKFYSVELIRRISSHHRELIPISVAELELWIQSIVEGLNSLRSSCVLNALYSSQELLPLLSSSTLLKIGSKVLSNHLLRIAKGPKFVVTLAEKTFDSLIKSIHPMIVIDTLLSEEHSFLQNKNTSLANKAIASLLESVTLLLNTELSDEMQYLLKKSLVVLYKISGLPYSTVIDEGLSVASLGDPISINLKCLPRENQARIAICTVFSLITSGIDELSSTFNEKMNEMKCVNGLNLFMCAAMYKLWKINEQSAVPVPDVSKRTALANLTNINISNNLESGLRFDQKKRLRAVVPSEIDGVKLIKMNDVKLFNSQSNTIFRQSNLIPSLRQTKQKIEIWADESEMK